MPKNECDCTMTVHIVNLSELCIIDYLPKIINLHFEFGTDKGGSSYRK